MRLVQKLGLISLFVYMLFTRFFPIVSIWEVQVGRERALPEVVARVRSYLPGGVPTPAEVER